MTNISGVSVSFGFSYVVYGICASKCNIMGRLWFILCRASDYVEFSCKWYRNFELINHLRSSLKLKYCTFRPHKRETRWPRSLCWIFYYLKSSLNKQRNAEYYLAVAGFLMLAVLILSQWNWKCMTTILNSHRDRGWRSVNDHLHAFCMEGIQFVLQNI